MGIVLSFALCAPVVATAQAEPIDRGTLTIRIADLEVAHEQFLLQPGRRGGLTGSTLRATAAYPAVRPRTQYHAIVERGAGQLLTAFQVEVGGNAPERTVAELVRGRLTVRIASPARETAREFPAGGDVVALDDSIYSLWIGVVDLATESGAQLRVIYPRTGWRGQIVATRQRIPGETPSISITGDLQGTILLDADGRFAGIALPGRRVEVLRVAER